MNRERDFDQTLRRWLDDGADRAPERFVWAALQDVEHTDQRGARWALLEGFLMKIKPAAPILGVAAVVVLAIAAYQLLGGNVGQPGPSPLVSPTPEITAARLPAIALITTGAPEGLTLDGSEDGEAALETGFAPGGPTPDSTGFIDAQLGEFSGAAGLVATWVALFETTADAERFFDDLANEHQSAEGWGFAQLSDTPRLGDASVGFDGAAGGADAGTTYLWRIDRLVLAVIGVDDFDRDVLRDMALAMVDRTR